MGRWSAGDEWQSLSAAETTRRYLPVRATECHENTEPGPGAGKRTLGQTGTRTDCDGCSSLSLSSQIDSRHHARASERTSNRPTGDCELRTSKRAAAAPAVAAPPRVGRPRLPLTFPNTNPDSLHRKTPNTANKNPHTTQITETYACTLLWYPHSVDLRICFSFIVTNLADYFLYTFSHFVSL